MKYFAEFAVNVRVPVLVEDAKDFADARDKAIMEFACTDIRKEISEVEGYTLISIADENENIKYYD